MYFLQFTYSIHSGKKIIPDHGKYSGFQQIIKLYSRVGQMHIYFWIYLCRFNTFGIFAIFLCGELFQLAYSAYD